MKATTKRTSAAVVGAGILALSLLAGALTSAAAAETVSRYDFGTGESTVEQPGPQRIDQPVVDAIRVESKRQTGRGGLVSAQPQHMLHQKCTVAFESADALFVQPNQSNDTIVRDPWREACGSRWAEVTATKHAHLHLSFVNPDIAWCPSGPLSGQFAVVDAYQNCTAIDPLTEPRTSPVSHYGDEIVELRTYDIDGYHPFRLDEIRIVDSTVSLCAQKQPPEDTIVANTNNGTSSTQCWTLGPGVWDLASYTSNTKRVTITGAETNGVPFSFDDIKIVNQ